MLQQFLSDLSLDDCIVQIGSENKVEEVLMASESQEKAVKVLAQGQKNIYFLGGVRAVIGLNRAADADVLKKNYLYFDFDLRSNHPAMTDAEIVGTCSWFQEVFAMHPTFCQWRYIVCSGNGLHVYYFADHGHEISDHAAWKLGMQARIEEMEELTGEKLDHACINLGRIARLPDSKNYKSDPPKSVQILAFQDARCDLIETMQEIGSLRLAAMQEETRMKAEKIKLQFPSSGGTYEAISAIPIAPLVQRIMGWETDGKHFTDPGSTKQKACFVPEGKNFLVHGGTEHLPAVGNGFSPFEFVKAAKNLKSNDDVFYWFKANFPEIEAISAKERIEKNTNKIAGKVGAGDISSVFHELENVRFEQLMIGGEWDRLRFMIRGAVTRIGAYSNIGKSKLAYYFAHRLLQSGYRGMIFSTEVVRSIVLANLLTIQTGHHFWDIIERRVSIDHKYRILYQQLEIYDVSHTQNNIANYELLIQRSIKEGNAPAFVIIDFCQGSYPAQTAKGEYEQMSKYALEVQSMAQRLNIAVIDLSQISNEGVRDEFRKVGMIPFKGSGHLYSSADIGILLKRDNKEDKEDNSMVFDIRKHKYMPPATLSLTCDFSAGTFRVFGDDFAEKSPVMSKAIGSISETLPF